MSTDAVAVREWEGTTIPPAGAYQLDPAHTRVGFVVKHMMVSKVRGNFGAFDASITIGENPLESALSATVQMDSVLTGQEARDNHLRTGDFFEIEKHPTMTYRSTGVASHSGTTFTLAGELTIKGVTRSVELAVELEGVTTSPFTGKPMFGFTATAEINREDFGLTYNQALETGGVMIGKHVKIEIEGEAALAG